MFKEMMKILMTTELIESDNNILFSSSIRCTKNFSMTILDLYVINLNLDLYMINLNRINDGRGCDTAWKQMNEELE